MIIESDLAPTLGRIRVDIRQCHFMIKEIILLTLQIQHSEKVGTQQFIPTENLNMQEASPKH